MTMSRTTYRPGDRLRDRGDHHEEIVLVRRVHDDPETWVTHRFRDGVRIPSWEIVSDSLDRYYNPIPSAAPACRCEYPCSCTQEAREREKDARIAELEAEVEALATEPRVKELEERLTATRESRDAKIKQANDQLTQRVLDAREQAYQLEQQLAGRATHRWGAEGWNLANRLTSAIERHRDTPGYVTSVRDMQLYRALDDDDA